MINIKDSEILSTLKLEMREEAINARRFFNGERNIEKYIFASTYKNTRHLQNLAKSLSGELCF